MKRSAIFLLLFFLFLFSCTRQVRKQVPPPPPEIETDAAVLAENYVSDGIDFYDAKKYKAAAASWNKALGLIPEDAEVYNFLGLAYHRLGKLDSAIIAYKKAVALDSSYYQAWNNLGYMYFLKSDYQQAMEHFEKSLEANPRYMQARRNRDKTRDILQGKLPIEVFELVEKMNSVDSLELKIKNYRKALNIDSNYVDAWNNLGVAYFYYGNTDSAVYCLRKALEKNPDYPPAHNNAGYILDAIGEHQKAVAHYQKAIQLRPDYVVAMANLLDAYVNKKEYSSAKAVLDALSRNYPNHVLVRERKQEYRELLDKETVPGGK